MTMKPDDYVVGTDGRTVCRFILVDRQIGDTYLIDVGELRKVATGGTTWRPAVAKLRVFIRPHSDRIRLRAAGSAHAFLARECRWSSLVTLHPQEVKSTWYKRQDFEGNSAVAVYAEDRYRLLRTAVWLLPGELCLEEEL